MSDDETADDDEQTTAPAANRGGAIVDEPEHDDAGDPEHEDEPAEDELADDVDESDDGEVDDSLSYDCSEWSGESRQLLDTMLTSAGIGHGWTGTILGVSSGDEDAVDALIDEVVAAADAGLDPDRAKVVYEVATWSSALQHSLAESLAVAEIAYEWDEHGDLVVYEDDEDRVEEIFDALPDPDDPDLVTDDGIEVQDLLSRLFVAAGHLAKRPTDADSVVAAAEVADRLEQLSVPFGFENAVWRNLVGLSCDLRDHLTEIDPGAQVSDEELKEEAGVLRTKLRAYV